MIFVCLRCCEVGDNGESEPATLGKGRSGLEVGNCTGVMDRGRFGWRRAGRRCGPSREEGPARGEETAGRDASVAGITR